MRNTISALVFSLSMVSLVVQPAAAQVTVTVDNAVSQAAIKDLLGVNVPPVFDAKTPGLSYGAGSLYTAFGVSQVRLHDSGLDLCSIYKAATKLNVGVTPSTTVTACTISVTTGIPHFMWTPTSSADADLNNTANYDFTDADDAIKKTLASGGKVFLGLAQRFNGPNDTTDPVAWAKVATNLYKHVIGTFKPTPGIAVDPAYIEIHNEPDGGFWQGDTATFITLYKEMTTRVRAAAAAAGKSAKVGGPGFTRDVLTKAQVSTNPANGFIAAVGVSSLDFYSAHLYDKCTNAALPASATYLRDLRSLVNTQGGSTLPLLITEWNIGLGQICGNDFYAEQRNQSFGSGILTLMQDPSLNIQAAHYYAGVTVMSLFDFTTVSGAVRINPAAWALWAHAKLNGTTMVDAKVCQGPSCAAGYAADSMPLMVLAGKITNGEEIVVTNDSVNSVTYDLQLKGLTGSAVDVTINTPPATAKDVSVSGSPLSADATQLATLMASPAKDSRKSVVVSGGIATVSLTIAARSVQMIEVRTAGTAITTPAQSDCLFSWAERTYPQYFAPSATSASVSPYYYRYYSGTKTYLATSTDNQVYVLGPLSGNALSKLGGVTTFMPTAGCWQ